MGIDNRILKAIGKMGFDKPMEVQRQVIPLLLQHNNDLIALAPTGTGKTAAYGIPLIQQTDTSCLTTQALILAPTRELCLQIADNLTQMSQYMENLRIVAIYGGDSIISQIRKVAQGAQIIVATPGRMLDMLKRKKVCVSKIQWLVLDEADEMLNMGFQEELNEVLASTPDEKTTLLFSATMPSGIEAIARRYMKNPREITVGVRNAGAESVSHQYCVARAKDRYATLKRIVDFHPGMYAIIFCRTRIETQEVADALIKDGYNADALHGDLSQSQRNSVMNRLRTRHLQMLAATDVAARGIDVSDLTHIVHYHLPDDLEYYTHRSGRAGRAGKTGLSLAIAGVKEEGRIKSLEKQIGQKFLKIPIPTGSEICRKQLAHLLEQFKSAEIQAADIEAFLPQAQASLKALSKEEIIARWVSQAFCHFPDYYRDAADINVAPKKDFQDASSTASAATDKLIRMSVNLGKMEKFNPKKLTAYLLETAGIAKLRLKNVEVELARSFFDIEPQFVEILMAKFAREKYEKRKVHIVWANQDGGGYGGRRKAAARSRESFFFNKRKKKTPGKKIFPKQKKY